jgi:CheY-like chemotaxis protein
MPVQTEVGKLVLVWIQDREALDLIREFLEPLGYTVESAPEALAAGENTD